MSTDSSENLLDKIKLRVKNHPIGVFFLLFGSIILVLGDVLDVFNTARAIISPTKPYVPQIAQVYLTLQPYKLTQGAVGTPISTTFEDIDGINALAEAIMTHIRDVVHPGSEPKYEAALRIEDGSLYSDKAMTGYLFVIDQADSVLQATERIELGDLTRGIRLSTRFKDRATFSPDCNCIHIEVNAPVDGYQSRTVDVYQYQDGHSFDPDMQVMSQAIELASGRVRILLEEPRGEGGTEKDVRVAQAGLFNAIASKIVDDSSFELALAFSEEELEAQTQSDLDSFPIGPAKEAYLEQNRVDYIIRVTFIMK